jgi:hypothetical protein
MIRRLLAALAVALSLASISPFPASAQLNDAQVAQVLVGVWVWTDSMNGVPVQHQLTLTGSGSFVYTSAMQTYQVTSSGTWIYQGGWIGFQTTSSTSLDPAGRPVGVGPVQVLDIGPDFVRTPAGIARRIQ